MEVVRSVVSTFALEQGPSVRLRDPLVKDFSDAKGTLGKKSTAREIDACPFVDADDGVGLQRGKGKETFLLGAWKGKLEKIKGFVDQVLACILEGVKECGPFLKPYTPKPTGCKKGVNLLAFTCKPKVKAKSKPKPKQVSILILEVDIGPKAGLEASLFAPVFGSSKTSSETIGSPPARLDDVEDLFLFPPKTELLLITNQKLSVAKVIPLILPVTILGASLDSATKSGVFRDDGSALTSLRLIYFADGHIQLSSRACSSTLNPSAD